MLRGRLTAAAAGVLVLAFGALAFRAQAHAGEVYGGVFAHDVDLGVTRCCYESGADLQLGVRGSPFVSLNRWGDLRPYAQGSVNTSGGVDFVSAGLAWRLRLGQRVYLQPALGVAVQDGSDAKYQKTNDRLYLGAPILFEPELTLGWRADERWSLEATYLHLSHAQLAGRQNPGMDDLGARIVRRF